MSNGRPVLNALNVNKNSKCSLIIKNKCSVLLLLKVLCLQLLPQSSALFMTGTCVDGWPGVSFLSGHVLNLLKIVLTSKDAHITAHNTRL